MGVKDSVINLIIRGRDLFSPAAKEAAGGAGELQAEIGKLNADLKDLGTQSKQVSKARELEIYGDMLRETMTSAQAALASMQAEMNKLQQPSAEAVSAFKRLKDETASLTERYNQNEAKLKTVQTSLRSAGIDFSNLAEEEKRLRVEAASLGDELSKLKGVKESAAKIDELRTNVDLAKKSYDQTTTALKLAAMQMEATAKPAQSLKDAHALAKQEASRASAAYQKLSRDLEQHEAALNSVGISSKEAGAIEKELSARITELQLRLAELNKTQKELGSNNVLTAQMEKQKADLLSTKSALEMLQNEFEQSNAAQREFGTRVAEAAKNAGIATRAFEQNEAKLKAMRTQLDQAGVDAKDLATAQGQLATATANASARLAEKQTKLRQIESSTNAAAQGTGALRDSINSLTARVLAFTATYVGLDRMLQGFKSIITTGGEFETLQQQLIGVFGDVQKGEEAFQWAVDLDKRLPVSLNEVLQAFVMLKNNGIDPMDGTLEKMINANVRYGKGTETLLPIIRQLTQSWAKNKIQAEEVYVLVENGLPVWQLLEQATGRTTQELMKMSEAGQLTREHMKLLIDTMGAAGAGVVEERMKTWNALVTKFKSNLEQAENTIAQSGALDELKDEVSGLNAEISKMAADGTLQRWGKEFANGLHSAIVNAKALFEAIGNLSSAISFLGQIFIGLKVAKFASEIGSLSGVFNKLAPQTTTVANGLQTMKTRLDATSQSLGKTNAEVINTAAGLTKLNTANRLAAAGFNVLKNAAGAIIWAQLISNILQVADAYAKMRDAQREAEKSDETRKQTQSELSAKFAELSEKLGITITSMEQLDQLAAEGKIHADEYTGAWEKGPATLDAVSASAQKAATGIGKYSNEVEAAAKQTTAAADQKASNYFQSIGVDAEQAAGKVGKATQENVANIHSLLATTNTASGAIYLAMEKAFDSTKNKAEIDAVANEIELLRQSGRLTGDDLIKAYDSAAGAAANLAKTSSDGSQLQIDLLTKQKQASDEAYKTTGLEQYKIKSGEVAAEIQKIKDEQDKAKASSDALASAYQTAGVTSTAALQQSVAEHKAAYDQITSAGTESIEQQKAVFMSWAEAEAKLAAATGKPIPAMIEAKAAALGLDSQLAALQAQISGVDGSAASAAGSLSSMGAAAAASGQNVGYATNNWSKMKDSVDQTNDSVKTYSKMTPLFQAETYDAAKATDYMSMSVSDLTAEIEKNSKAAADMARNSTELMGPSGYESWISAIDGQSSAVYRMYENLGRAALAVKNLQEGLSTNPSEVLINKAEHALSKYKELGEQNLSGLRSAISAAKSQMDSLNSSVQSTLNSLRDEMDEMNNNQAAIENRRYQTQVTELEAKLAEAKALSDKSAADDVREAMRLAQQIHNQKMANIKAEQEAAKTEAASSSSDSSTTSTPTATQSTSAKQITITLGGTSATIQADSINEAALDNILSQLEKASQLTLV